MATNKPIMMAGAELPATGRALAGGQWERENWQWQRQRQRQRQRKGSTSRGISPSSSHRRRPSSTSTTTTTTDPRGRATHHYPAYASRDRAEAWRAAGRRRGARRAGSRVKARWRCRRGRGIGILYRMVAAGVGMEGGGGGGAKAWRWTCACVWRERGDGGRRRRRETRVVMVGRWCCSSKECAREGGCGSVGAEGWRENNGEWAAAEGNGSGGKWRRSDRQTKSTKTPPARPAGNSSQTAEGDWASQHDRRVKRAPCRNRPSAEAWACGEGAMRCGILEVNLRCSALSTACIIRGIQRGGRCDGSDW